MRDKLVVLGINVKKAFSGMGRVFSNLKYIILAIVLAFLFSLLIYFSINYSFYGSLLFSQPAGTIGLLAMSTVGSYFADMNGILLFSLSILQGVALSLLIYNFRNGQQLDKKTATGSGLAAIAAVIGLGCVSCGTSLIVPIVTLIFSSSSYLLLNAANAIVLSLAILLSVYSIYKMGLIVHVNYLTNQWMQEAKDAKV